MTLCVVLKGALVIQYCNPTRGFMETVKTESKAAKSPRMVFQAL
jgi:hypothetical protein